MSTSSYSEPSLLIRPILRGKDLRKYFFDNRRQYLICFPSGFTNKRKGSCDALEWFKKEYFAIYNFLISKSTASIVSKGKGLFGRDDQGDFWWELRRCAYWDDFSKPVIAWQRITQENRFSITKSGFVILDSMAFLSNTKEYTYYLLALLNSPIMYYWMQKNVPQYGNKGFRLSNQFVSKFPAPKIASKDLAIFNKLVSVYLVNPTETILNQINEKLFSIYSFSDEEKKMLIKVC